MINRETRCVALLLIGLFAMGILHSCPIWKRANQRHPYATEIAVAEKFLSEHAWGFPVALLTETVLQTKDGVQISIRFGDEELAQITVMGQQVAHNLHTVIGGKEFFLRVPYNWPWIEPGGAYAKDVPLSGLYNTRLRITEVNDRWVAFFLADKKYWLPLCALSDQPSKMSSELFAVSTEVPWGPFPDSSYSTLKEGSICRRHLLINNRAFVSFASGPDNSYTEQGWVNAQALVPLADALVDGLSARVLEQATSLVRIYLQEIYKELSPNCMSGVLSHNGVSFDANISLGAEAIYFKVFYDGSITDTLIATLNSVTLYARQSLEFFGVSENQEGSIKVGEKLTVSDLRRSAVLLARVQSKSGQGWIPLWSCGTRTDDVITVIEPVEMIVTAPVSLSFVPMHGKYHPLLPGLVVQVAGFHDEWAFVWTRYHGFIEEPRWGWLPKHALRDFDLQYSREGVIGPGTILYEAPGQEGKEVISQEEIVFIVEEEGDFARIERMHRHYWVARGSVTRCNPWRPVSNN